MNTERFFYHELSVERKYENRDDSLLRLLFSVKCVFGYLKVKK